MIIRYLLSLFLCATASLATLLAPAAPAWAVEPAAASATSAAAEPDPLARETPRSAISNLLQALADQDYERAALYFDVPTTGSRQQRNGPEQARRLLVLLDNGGSLKPFASLSNDEEGEINDDLPIDREQVGTITIAKKKVPVLLARGMDEPHQVWRISRETISQLMAASTPAGDPKDDDALLIGGAPIEDWLKLLGLAAASFGGLWIAAALIVSGLQRRVAEPGTNSVLKFVQAALPPLSLLAAVAIFYTWADRLPVSIVARQILLRYIGVFAVVALVWLALRLIDAIAELAIARMQRRQARQVISVVTLLKRTVKFLLLAFSGVAVLDTFGIDVTTGIAALGIGGIALALGAQKTVENLVGSVTFIADRPAQIGDFVRVGDVTGTIEDVGIRSTRIRTGERTVITIPNGDLSARQIENFATRDRFLFNPVIAVAHGISYAKLLEAIDIVQQILRDHEKIAEGARARLARLAERSIDIEVFSYIDVSDFDESVIIREELLLQIYARFEHAGLRLAYPEIQASTRQFQVALDAEALAPLLSAARTPPDAGGPASSSAETSAAANTEASRNGPASVSPSQSVP